MPATERPVTYIYFRTKCLKAVKRQMRFWRDLLWMAR